MLSNRFSSNIFRFAAALGGIASAALALSVGELIASINSKTASLVLGVGELIVDTAPGGLIRQSIETLGTSQKTILLSSIVVLTLLFGSFLGLLLLVKPTLSKIIFTFFGIFGAWSVARNPLTSIPLSLTLALISTLSGLLALTFFERLLKNSEVSNIEDPRMTYSDRRQFFGWATGMSLAAGSITGIGHFLIKDDGITVARKNLTLPKILKENTSTTNPQIDSSSSSTTSTTLPTQELQSLNIQDVDGLSPYITPNNDFYRIDTALRLPTVDPQNWSLKINGFVENPIEITYQDVLEMNLVEKAVTLACVSNEVGGSLVGNAIWTGVPLTEIIKLAEPLQEAEQVMCTSVDGFTAGFPLQNLFDGRTALLAIGMNGEPLPILHGFPARLVVAGLYGYVSAVKWIERIELTAWEGRNGFWIPRGWSKEAPVKIASRIDVPKSRKIESGLQAVAGVAWAPNSGVNKVEISIDDGPWELCELGLSITGESWVQWLYSWKALPGRYKIRVRATDNRGQKQSSNVVNSAPNGAEGYDEVSVRVV